jgi:succinyl-CoA synthetase alpha subunit
LPPYPLPLSTGEREGVRGIDTKMGHAGAIVRGSAWTVAVKQETLRKAGVEVLESPMHVAPWAKKHGLR